MDDDKRIYCVNNKSFLCFGREYHIYPVVYKKIQYNVFFYGKVVVFLEE